jgi:hypothetical protein
MEHRLCWGGEGVGGVRSLRGETAIKEERDAAGGGMTKGGAPGRWIENGNRPNGTDQI